MNYLLSTKFFLGKFSSFIKLDLKDHLKYNMATPSQIEEIANIYSPVYFRDDLSFYRFSNGYSFINSKLFFKIRKSVKLRNSYGITSNLKKNSTSFIKYFFLGKKKNVCYYLNYWGRIKKFNYDFFGTFTYNYFYFYKYHHYSRVQFFLKKGKLSDLHLKMEVLGNCFLFDLGLVIYFPIFCFFSDNNVQSHFNIISNEEKNIRLWSKGIIFRSIPNSKLRKYFFSLFKFKFGAAKFKVKKVNIFFFDDLLNNFKIFCLCVSTAQKFLFTRLFEIFGFLIFCELGALGGNYVFLFFLILNVFELKFNGLAEDLFLLFFEFFGIFFFGFFKTEFGNKNRMSEIFFLSIPTIPVLGSSLTFIGYEGFITSHMFNYGLKNYQFSFYLGYSIFLTMPRGFLLSLNAFLFKDIIFIIKFFESYWCGVRQSHWNCVKKRKNFLIFPFFKFLFSGGSIGGNFFSFTRKFDSGYFFSQFGLSLIFFLLDTKLRFVKVMEKKGAINLLSHLSLTLNKHLHMDSISPFFVSVFNLNYSSYNYCFFIGQNFSSLYLLMQEISCLPFKLEFVFFFKKMLYGTNYIMFENLGPWVKSYIFIANNNGVRRSNGFFNLLEANWWFDNTNFLEELFHLARESSLEDLDGAQEFICLKQLAEVRLERLTDYLKDMRLKKVEIGNVQYSPDFTQAHEFGLTLKWGLEVEAIRKTGILILKGFHGSRLISFRANYVNKKLEFLYELGKSKYLTITSVKEILVENLILPNSLIEMSEQLKLKKDLKILTRGNFFEMTGLTLASIVAINRDIHKYAYDQLDSFYIRFNVYTERFLQDLYNFIFLSFDGMFYKDIYSVYYGERKIKRGIRFFKLLKKTVFMTFMEKINFFFLVTDLGNSFNLSLFLKFGKLRRRFAKLVKDKFFYKLIHSIVFRNSGSFFFPTDVTKNDYQMYLYTGYSVLPIFTIKYILMNKYLNFTSGFYYLLRSDEIFPTLLQDSTYFYSFYKLLALPHFKLNCDSRANKFFFSFISQPFNFEIFINPLDVEAIFLNFCSEYFYELYANFFKSLFSSMYLITKSKKNRFQHFNIYQNLLSNAFSVSFFYFLNVKTFKKTGGFGQRFIFFLNQFFNSSLGKIIMIDFIQGFKNYFFLNLNFKYNLDLNHLCFMSSIIGVKGTFLIDKCFRQKLVLMFFYGLQKLSSIDDVDMTLGHSFFNYTYLLTYSSNLEMFFIEFIVKVMGELFGI